MGELWLNGRSYSGGGGADVEITPLLATGTKIAEYEIDGVSGDLYAPSGGSGDYSEIVEKDMTLAKFFYKGNTYINASGQEVTLNGYDTYKLPVGEGDIIIIKSIGNELFYGELNKNYVFNALLSDDSYSPILDNTYYTYRRWSPSIKEFKAWGDSDVKAYMFTVKRGNESNISIEKNDLYDFTLTDDNKLTINNEVRKVDENNFASAASFKNTATTWYNFSSPYLVVSVNVKAGDVIKFAGLPSGLSYYGTFMSSDGSWSSITNKYFEASADGVVDAFRKTDSDNKIYLYPKDGLTVDYKNIQGLPDNQYKGLNAVAFGTSLTYRAQSTGGYLQYLPQLSGMTIDNQGIGSSTILNDMLTAIKGYSGYGNKNVCILEGFVNDWYGNGSDLGVYTDNTENTVCGCVRSALNYMLSQNTNMTIFLVLDHYGRDYNSVDCSSDAVRDGHTQYEFYEEIAKVAESLGIPVIKLYAISGMSENTPRYFIDNIHPNATGAEQTANVIWSQMRQYVINL